MAKAEIRIAEATPTLAESINKGFEADAQVKNYKYQDEACKKQIIDLTKETFAPEDGSIRFTTEKAAALVTRMRSVSLQAECQPEALQVFKNAVEQGVLTAVVEVSTSTQVNPANLEEIKKLIGDILFQKCFTTKTSYSINRDALVALEESKLPNNTNVAKVVRDVTVEEDSYRVKYESLKKKEKSSQKAKE